MAGREGFGCKEKNMTIAQHIESGDKLLALTIEKGRLLNVPPEQRLCTARNQIADEIRFLDKCIKII